MAWLKRYWWAIAVVAVVVYVVKPGWLKFANGGGPIGGPVGGTNLKPAAGTGGEF